MGGFGHPYLFLSFITGIRILCRISTLDKTMKHKRISDTVIDVTGLYCNLKYPDQMLQWSLKGQFFRKALCWYLENRFTARMRAMSKETRRLSMLQSGVEYIMKDIPVRSRNDPTQIVRVTLNSLFNHIEIFIRNPGLEYLNKEPLVQFTQLDMPSDHPYKFKLLKPKKENRTKVDPFGLRVMGRKHYYLALRQGGDDE